MALAFLALLFSQLLVDGTAAAPPASGEAKADATCAVNTYYWLVGYIAVNIYFAEILNGSHIVWVRGLHQDQHYCLHCEQGKSSESCTNCVPDPAASACKVPLDIDCNRKKETAFFPFT
jgi:hypothetical protein